MSRQASLRPGGYPVWPRPQQMSFTGGRFLLASPIGLSTRGQEEWLRSAAAQVASILNQEAGRVVVDAGITGRGGRLMVTTMDGLPKQSGLRPVRKPEGYLLSITRRRVLLAGADAAGVFYGAQTLAELLSAGDGAGLPCVTIRDWPRFGMRGTHLYLPPREQLGFFFRFLDFMARTKCNTLVLEIGGGMEYERHPEINVAWERFCKEALAYDPARDPNTGSMASRLSTTHPTGPCALQASRYFAKDSTHPELAGGTWLTKSEVRDIVAACAARHIEIVPEVQSLSHAYYLCTAHPDTAERADDPWPDTYCPSNPRSYELLFDVMDEVIEVFNPRTIHIGHDEAYTFRVCPRCRRRTARDILAEDIRKNHEFLKSRGVRTMMWGDKLMNITTPDGRRYGGVERRRTDSGTGRKWIQPATWKAVDRVPKDLLILDWYYSLDPKSERKFGRHGFDVVFGNFLGNFTPTEFPDWEGRAGASNVLGAEMSSWCEVSAGAFGHNGMAHKVFKGADMLWRGLQLGRGELSPLMAKRMAAATDDLTQAPRWLVHGRGRNAFPLDISHAASPLPGSVEGGIRTPHTVTTATGTGPFEVLRGADGHLDRAISLDRSNPRSEAVPIGRKASRLIVLHATTLEDVYCRPTYYSFHRGPAVLLKYRVTYADGKHASFDALFGDDIGPLVGIWPTGRGGFCYRAVPVAVGKSHTLFAQEWANPRPDTVIKSLRVRLGEDAEGHGEVLLAAVTLVPV